MLHTSYNVLLAARYHLTLRLASPGCSLTHNNTLHLSNVLLMKAIAVT